METNKLILWMLAAGTLWCSLPLANHVNAFLWYICDMSLDLVMPISNEAEALLLPLL